jgi:transposase InsO family protein
MGLSGGFGEHFGLGVHADSFGDVLSETEGELAGAAAQVEEASGAVQVESLDEVVKDDLRIARSITRVVLHHTDRGSQYTSIRFSERLAEAGIQPSVGAVGSSYDNALAESINGLYKTELIRPRRPWRAIEEVELATAEWVHWSNHRRLYEYCGDIPPVELETAYYAQHRGAAAG